MHLNLTPEAKFTRHLTGTPVQIIEAPRPSKLRVALFYGVIVVGVGVAAFILTPSPAKAGGSMGSEVKIIRVNPSGRSVVEKEWRDGLKAEAKAQSAAAKEARKSEARRQLEADKAYYKRLEAQRKGKK